MSESSRTPFWKSPYLWALLIGMVTLTLIRPLLRHEPDPPPVLGRLPAFELQTEEGGRFGNAELSGRVWVVDFIFTRCQSICPLLTAAMGRLQDRLDEQRIDGVGLISITVDPTYDTPEVLRGYGEQNGIDRSRWRLLTGTEQEIRTLAVDGFRLGVGESRVEDSGMIDIAHSGKFVLVDGEGGVRGYYDTDRMGLDEVFHRAQHVLRQQERNERR